MKAYWGLLAAGLIVSILVGLFAGFTLRDGAITSRAQETWLASTTVLVDSGQSTLYQSEIPPSETTEEGVVAPSLDQDLTDLAIIYAYLVSSADLRARVEASIGNLSDLESITAVSRTTQPSGSEQSPGRLSLPILDIVGGATSADRAELISRTANDEFQAYIIERQNAQGLPDEIRVTLDTLSEKSAIRDQGSNPAIPVIVAAGGTFLIFVALAYLLYGSRSSRRNRNRSRARS